jgi:hypothetical protein
VSVSALTDFFLLLTDSPYYFVTVNKSVVLAWLLLWSVPVTVTVNVPLFPCGPTVISSSELPEPETVLGVNVAELLLGSPVADRPTILEAEAVTFTVTAPCAEFRRDKVIVEEGLRDKLRVLGGGGCVTVTCAEQFAVVPSLAIAVPV